MCITLFFIQNVSDSLTYKKKQNVWTDILRKKIFKAERYQSSSIIHPWSNRCFILRADSIIFVWAFIVWKRSIKVHEKHIQVMLYVLISKYWFKSKVENQDEYTLNFIYWCYLLSILSSHLVQMSFRMKCQFITSVDV